LVSESFEKLGFAMRKLQMIRMLFGSRFFGCELTEAKPILDSELSHQVVLRFYENTVA
jgi:hypothetical protein